MLSRVVVMCHSKKMPAFRVKASPKKKKVTRKRKRTGKKSPRRAKQSRTRTGLRTNETVVNATKVRMKRGQKKKKNTRRKSSSRGRQGKVKRDNMNRENAAAKRLLGKFSSKSIKCPDFDKYDGVSSGSAETGNDWRYIACNKRVQDLIKRMPDYDTWTEDERDSKRKSKYGKNKRLTLKLVPRGALRCPRWCPKGKIVYKRDKTGKRVKTYKLDKAQQLCHFLKDRCENKLRKPVGGRYVFTD